MPINTIKKTLQKFTCIGITFLIVLVIFTNVFPHKAMAWGAIDGVATTHQLILKLAYQLLSKDPAFVPADFPSLESILANEGVNPITKKGPGPDGSDSNSPWSDHYYNPRMSVGGAPDAVSREFLLLIEGMTQQNRAQAAHAAAWGAHFLADVGVPYHVNGLPGDLFDRNYIKTKEDEYGFLTLPLDGSITGWLGLNYGSALTHDNDFLTEATNFLLSDEWINNEGDWFDPWYWNGVSPAPILSSSHVLWEGFAGNINTGLVPLNYSGDWSNCMPEFPSSNDKASEVWDNQAQRTWDFAIKAAKQTSASQTTTFTDPAKAIELSAQRVASLWRASFSALKPSIEIDVPDPDAPHKITATITVQNTGNGISSSTKIRLTITNGILADGGTELIQSIGAIKSNESVNAVFEVEATESNGCKIKAEVIGDYNQPDLQYAVTEINTSVVYQKATNSVALLVDCSGQMAGTTVYDYMYTITKSLNSLPPSVAEVSMWLYGGDTPEEVNIVHGKFEHPDVYKQRFEEAERDLDYWKDAVPMGKSPLASAITDIGDYIQEESTGNNAVIVYIGAGVDDCGGDPIEAAHELDVSSQPHSFRFPFEGIAHAAGKNITLQVVGMKTSSAAQENRLKELAAAGRGQYFPVSDIEQLSSAISKAIESGINRQPSGFQFQTWWLYAIGIIVIFIMAFVFGRKLIRSNTRPVQEVASVTPYPTVNVPQPVTTKISYCPKCGTQRQPGAAFCIKCGFSLSEAPLVSSEVLTQEPVYCPQCGIQNTAGSRFCNKCGAPILPGITQNQIPIVKSPDKKASRAWWLLPIFLLLPGGVIAWAVLRKENPSLARRILMFGLSITILLIIVIIQNFI